MSVLENCEGWCIEHLLESDKCKMSKEYCDLLVNFSNMYKGTTFIFGDDVMYSFGFSTACFIVNDKPIFIDDLEDRYEGMVRATFKADESEFAGITFVGLTDTFKDSFLSWDSMFWVKDGVVYNAKIL